MSYLKYEKLKTQNSSNQACHRYKSERTDTTSTRKHQNGTVLKLRRGTKETSNATPSSTQNYQTSHQRLVSKGTQTKTFNPLSRHANIASLVYNINTNQTGDTNTCLSNQTGSSSQTSASASWLSGQSLSSTPSSTDKTNMLASLTIGHLISYYGICLIAWLVVCERLPFEKVIYASLTALFFCALPFVVLTLAQGAT